MISNGENDIKASLVIPVYNNEKTLISQLKKCHEVMAKTCLKYEIIVCDDSSTDSSASLLKNNFSVNSQFKYIHHLKNQGIAKTILSLYRKAQYSYVVLFSVDGDWDPEDIGKLLNFAYVNNADIVIGKRSRESYSLYRKVLSFFYNFLSFLIFQVNTIDAGSIKVIRNEIIKSTHITSGSVFFEAEIIIRSAKRRKKIMSMPIYFKRPRNKKSFGGKFTLIYHSLIDLINLRLSI